MLSARLAFKYIEYRRRLEQAKERGERRAGMKIGAFIRRRTRTDILRRTGGKGQRASVKRVRNGVVRKVQKTASPGKPPIVRSKSKFASLRNIRFAYSSTDRVVYIGPVGIGRRLSGSNESTVAGLMERGGTGRVPQWRPKGSSVWSLGNVRRGVDRRSARARYAKHPFMGPGLQKEVDAGTIPKSWTGVVY